MYCTEKMYLFVALLDAVGVNHVEKPKVMVEAMNCSKADIYLRDSERCIHPSEVIQCNPHDLTNNKFCAGMFT